jgi:hypothetical protein
MHLNDVIRETDSVSSHLNSNRDRAVDSLDREQHSDSSLGETVLFQPWFLPQHIGFAIRSLVPPQFRSRMRYFFEDYGCMICGTESGYHSNGMCRICGSRIRKKIMLSVKRRSKSNPHQRLDLELFRQERLARKLLGKFSQRRKGGPKARRIGPERSNPVYEALSARFK